MHDAVTLLWIAALHILLTAAPLVAVMLFAARRGVRDVPLLLVIGLLGSGGLAIASFWAYFASRWIGRVCSYAILTGSIAVAVWCIRALSKRLLRRLATPLALWSLAALFVVFLGFLHGGTDKPLLTAANRFSHPLPSDNSLPFSFGDWFSERARGAPPPVGDALSSDRPPLQIGYALEQRVFEWDDAELHYQVLGVTLQQLWIIGLWALLSAARVRRATRGLALIAVLMSDVAIVHGFYVWPKMLAASFLLAAAALLLTPRWAEERHRPGAAVLAAGLFGLAMLAHGTSIFGIIAIAVVALVRGLPSWRWLVTGAVVGAALLSPWALYQRYVDPPGNRLTKEAFAGVLGVDRRSTSEAVVDAYRDAGFSGVVENKKRNFVVMTVGEGENSFHNIEGAIRRALSGDTEEAVRVGRGVRFFPLLLSLGPFVLAPVVMLLTRRWRRPVSEDWSLGVTGLGCVAVGCVLWGLILFGPAQSIIHQGSLALPVLAIVGAVAGLRAVLPRLALVVVLLNVVVVLLLYVPVIDPMPGTGYSPAAATTAAVCLLAFVVVVLRSHELPARHDPRDLEGVPLGVAVVDGFRGSG